jgi:hypothetical protein
MSDQPTVFVIGPPAAGKSTIGRVVAEQLGRSFRSIDDWTAPALSMTDAEVDVALRLLFGAASPKNEIIEFCHHAYESLLECDTFPIFTSADKIVVTAPLAVCNARNGVRRSPVQADYLARAWHSSEYMIHHWAIRFPSSTLVIDTSCYPVEAATAAAVSFLTTEWRSK